MCVSPLITEWGKPAWGGGGGGRSQTSSFPHSSETLLTANSTPHFTLLLRTLPRTVQTLGALLARLFNPIFSSFNLPLIVKCLLKKEKKSNFQKMGSSLEFFFLNTTKAEERRGVARFCFVFKNNHSFWQNLVPLVAFVPREWNKVLHIFVSSPPVAEQSERMIPTPQLRFQRHLWAYSRSLLLGTGLLIWVPWNLNHSFREYRAKKQGLPQRLPDPWGLGWGSAFSSSLPGAWHPQLTLMPQFLQWHLYQGRQLWIKGDQP